MPKENLLIAHDDAQPYAKLLHWVVALLDRSKISITPKNLGAFLVPCYGGWYPLKQAWFSCEKLAAHFDTLAKALPKAQRQRLQRNMLLPFSDAHWGAASHIVDLEKLTKGGGKNYLPLDTAQNVLPTICPFSFEQRHALSKIILQALPCWGDLADGKLKSLKDWLCDNLGYKKIKMISQPNAPYVNAGLCQT